MKTFAQLIAALGILFGVGERGSAQGFVNLNFEAAQLYLPPIPSGQVGGNVDPNLAFNGWTVTNAMGPLHYPVFSLYNSATLGSAGVALMGPQFPNIFNLTPLQGSYSVMLMQGVADTNFTGLPGLMQRGSIAADVRSISFLTTVGSAAGRLFVDGAEIPLVPFAGGRIAGDISAFAGRDVNVMVSLVPGASAFYFDDVQFSTASVPEPSVWGLVSIATITFAFAMKRRASKR